MRISVFGCGYLGAVHAAAMAELGHDVIGIDVDADKVRALTRGVAPFHEPGLTELLERGLTRGLLAFDTRPWVAQGATVHFVCVGTPQRADGSVDLRYVDDAFDAVLDIVRPGDVVVGKSTVPVGTAARLAIEVEAHGASLVWNPEFLREGFAVRDTLEPDRLVYGARAGDDAVAVLDVLYASILERGTPRIVTDWPTAELVKVAANSFLATKISFINAMAEVAEAVGADVTTLADAIGHDPRIGRRFLNAGIGFGGGCLPKDIRGFVVRAEELGVGESVAFLKEVDAINLRRRDRVVSLVKEALGGDVTGRSIAVLGLAFKPDSDDVRDSPALDIADRLRVAGARVRATDPAALETARRRHPEIDYRATVVDACGGVEAVVLATEWAAYRALDPTALRRIVVGRTTREGRPDPVIVDGRNVLDHEAWRAAGWRVMALGRPSDPVRVSTPALAR